MSELQAMITRFRQLKIVPVIAVDNAEDIIPLGNALADNGLPVAEITFRTECAAEAIKLLREARPDMLVGAGTVINREQVRQAKAAGAQFVVSPGLNRTPCRRVSRLISRLCRGLTTPARLSRHWSWASIL